MLLWRVAPSCHQIYRIARAPSVSHALVGTVCCGHRVDFSFQYRHQWRRNCSTATTCLQHFNMSTAAGIIAVFMLSPTVYTYARSPHAHHLPTLNVHTRLSSYDQIDVTGAKRIHGRPVLSLPERLPHLRVLIVKEVSFFFFEFAHNYHLQAHVSRYFVLLCLATRYSPICFSTCHSPHVP